MAPISESLKDAFARVYEVPYASRILALDELVRR